MTSSVEWSVAAPRRSLRKLPTHTTHRLCHSIEHTPAKQPESLRPRGIELSDYAAAAKVLCGAGAPLEAKFKNHRPIQYAKKHGSDAVVQVLLAAGAKPAVAQGKKKK